MIKYYGYYKSLKTGYDVTEKIAAVACGEKMYRVCYENGKGDWYPIWNAVTYDNFEAADKAAREYCNRQHHNVISQYINMR
jgi:hypothetical protein